MMELEQILFKVQALLQDNPELTEIAEVSLIPFIRNKIL